MGLLPFVVVHPYVRAIPPMLLNGLVELVHFVFVRIGVFKDRAFSGLWKWRKRYREGMNADQDDGERVDGGVSPFSFY